MAEDVADRIRTTVTILLWLVGFPVLWPLHVVRGAWRARRHRARTARIDPGAAGRILERTRRGEARSALRSTLSWSTIASGPEEEVCLEVTFDDSSEVTPATRELEQALAAHRVPTNQVETHQLGIALIFAWGVWLISVLVLSALVSGKVGYAVVAALVLVALVALGLS